MHKVYNVYIRGNISVSKSNISLKFENMHTETSISSFSRTSFKKGQAPTVFRQSHLDLFSTKILFFEFYWRLKLPAQQILKFEVENSESLFYKSIFSGTLILI